MPQYPQIPFPYSELARDLAQKDREIIRQLVDGNWDYYFRSLGVNTAPGTYRVDISGAIGGRSLNITSADTTASSYLIYGTKTGAATTNYGLYLDVSGATNNYAIIVANGRVGIGDTTPSDNLDVLGSVRIQGDANPANTHLLIDSDSNIGPHLVAHTDKDGKSTANFASGRWNVSASGHVFGTSPATAAGVARLFTERMRIEIAGNVGIGTSDPTTLLHVFGQATIGAAASVPPSLLEVNRNATTTNSETLLIRTSGFTQTITTAIANARFNQFLGNTISAATAQTVTSAATVYIEKATSASGVGPASISNNYSLWVDEGELRFDGNIEFGAGNAIVAGDYMIGRDNDGTNQFHINVPTGATIEMSVNDVNELTLSSTGLDIQGNLITATGGINFGNTTLSNYLESTFTPTITLVGGVGNTVPQYTTNSGRYTRTGNMVIGRILTSGDGGNEGAGTGQVNIALPIAVSASSPDPLFFYGEAINGANSYMILAYFTPSATTMALYYFNAINTTANFTGNDQNNTSRRISIVFAYEV